jgi:hypothetical protein
VAFGGVKELQRPYAPSHSASRGLSQTSPVSYSIGATNTNLIVKSACRTPFILPARYRLNMVILDKNIGE